MEELLGDMTEDRLFGKEIKHKEPKWIPGYFLGIFRKKRITIDLSYLPSGWDMNKWLYFKSKGLIVLESKKFIN